MGFFYQQFLFFYHKTPCFIYTYSAIEAREYEYILLLRQLMSDYKGFITQAKLAELTSQVKEIADTRGLENQIHHLYQPDTDMADIICEDFETSKEFIILNIYSTINKFMNLAYKISKLRRDT